MSKLVLTFTFMIDGGFKAFIKGSKKFEQCLVNSEEIGIMKRTNVPS